MDDRELHADDIAHPIYFLLFRGFTVVFPSGTKLHRENGMTVATDQNGITSPHSSVLDAIRAVLATPTGPPTQHDRL